MIVHAELDKAQSDAFRAEATRQGCTPNALARRILAQYIYAVAVRHMDPARQPKQHVGDDWL